MLDEALEALAIRPAGKYVDATFGRGGHTRGILERLDPEGRVLATDQGEVEAIKSGQDELSEEKRLALWHGSFGDLEHCVKEKGWLGQVDGILLRFSVSSPQLDTPERGFSFWLMDRWICV